MRSKNFWTSSLIAQTSICQKRDNARTTTPLTASVADAAHLSFAEQAEADLVTVDDRFIKRAKRAKPSVWIGTPLEYCEKEKLK